LQDIRKHIDEEKSIPAIAYGLNRLREAVDDSIGLIEKEKGGGGKHPKPIQDFSPTTVQKKVYLESELDIEEFLVDLRMQLQAALSLGVRIRIK
jgi:hypothetical protein